MADMIQGKRLSAGKPSVSGRPIALDSIWQSGDPADTRHLRKTRRP